MPSRQSSATVPAKQPAKGPPLASEFSETISVKNQCPPLFGSNRHETSPPLLYPLAVSPMRVSSGMGADLRCRAGLKTRISPMLLVSTTYLLLAHSPWSAGSMSGGTRMLVLSVPLSTAFRPFTPFAPPADVLIGSQPGPSGWQLTAGGVGSAPSRLKTGDGIACGPSFTPAASCFAVAAFFAAAAAAGDEADRPAVDGAGNGPVSREQPAVAQPVAAGPVKVGDEVPRLDEVTVLVALTVLVVVATRADAAPPERTTSATGSDNRDSSANNLRTRLDIEPTIASFPHPQRSGRADAPIPRTRGSGTGRHRARAGEPVRDFIVPVGD